MDKLVPELLPEYATEYTWSRKAVDAARGMGAAAFADWLERYVFNRKEEVSR